MSKLKVLEKIFKNIYVDIIVCLVLGQAVVASNKFLENFKLSYSVSLFGKGLVYGIIFLILAIFFRFLMVKLSNMNSKFEKLYSRKI